MIFEVEITAKVIVVADDEWEANDVAAYSIMEIEEFDTDCLREVKSLSDLHGGWDGDCIPYGAGEDKRLKDILPE